MLIEKLRLITKFRSLDEIVGALMERRLLERKSAD